MTVYSDQTWLEHFGVLVRVNASLPPIGLTVNQEVSSILALTAVLLLIIAVNIIVATIAVIVVWLPEGAVGVAAVAITVISLRFVVLRSLVLVVIERNDSTTSKSEGSVGIRLMIVIISVSSSILMPLKRV